MARPMVYRRLRAPAEDGGVLLDPPAGEISALIAANVARRSSGNVDLGGRSLGELRRDARIHVLQAARDYTSRYADASWVDARLSNDRIYVTGHQPELFHPGVWLKNFVLDALARRDGALAVHVLIDNDEAHAPAIRVPAGSLAEPRIENVAFDEATAACAWEERAIEDAATFGSFGKRVRETIAPLVADPLVAALWRDAAAVLKSTSNIGRALAQMRHQREIAWGVRSLEVPLSSLIDSPAFHYFTAYLLAELPRFHAAHNASLDEYRSVHKLRSASQPLPDLAAHDGWHESPFWIWTKQDATRRKLLLKREGDIWSLQAGLDGESRTGTLARRDATNLTAYIESLRQSGVKIRPRALVTTMMLRLLASDLFIHGIGGAKYDQVTDRIIEEFFGIEPPGFLTATGTRLLPVPLAIAAAGDVEQIDRLLRELRFKPEDHVDIAEHGDGERSRIEQLIADKRRWLRAEVPPEKLAERHRALAEINAALENYVSSRRAALSAERLRVEHELRRQAILGSREFSFCLYPEATLREWLLDAAAQAL